MGERLVVRSEDGQGNAIELYESTDRNLEVHVDGIHGLSVRGTTVKFNFFTLPPQTGGENSQRREVACRVTMGVETFLSVAAFLQQQADSIRRNVQSGDGGGAPVVADSTE